MMLMALTNENKRVMSVDGDKNQSYQCPICQNPVILKKGTVKIPHFAHKRHQDCSGFSEPETYEHLKGKYVIAKNCEKFDLSYEVECYLPSIKQRPDVLIEGHIAIEFQCSPLSIERLKERTAAYKHAGYEVYWIIGGKIRQCQKLSGLKQHVLRFNSCDSYHYIELDVEEETLHVIRCVAKTYPKTHQQELIYPLDQLNCLKVLQREVEIHPYIVTSSLDLGCLSPQKRHWQKQLCYKHKIVLGVQEYLYQENSNLLNLPYQVYLPMIYHPFIGEWEYVIRHIVWHALREHSVITYEELCAICVSSLTDIVTLEYVNLSTHQIIDYCISIYIAFLQRVSLVEKKGESYVWQVEKDGSQSDIKEYLKNKVEFLSLPLKYDMIDK